MEGGCTAPALKALRQPGGSRENYFWLIWQALLNAAAWFVGLAYILGNWFNRLDFGQGVKTEASAWSSAQTKHRCQANDEWAVRDNVFDTPQSDGGRLSRKSSHEHAQSAPNSAEVLSAPPYSGNLNDADDKILLISPELYSGPSSWSMSSAGSAGRPAGGDAPALRRDGQAQFYTSPHGRVRISIKVEGHEPEDVPAGHAERLQQSMSAWEHFVVSAVMWPGCIAMVVELQHAGYPPPYMVFDDGSDLDVDDGVGDSDDGNGAIGYGGVPLVVHQPQQPSPGQDMQVLEALLESLQVPFTAGQKVAVQMEGRLYQLVRNAATAVSPWAFQLGLQEGGGPDAAEAATPPPPSQRVDCAAPLCALLSSARHFPLRVRLGGRGLGRDDLHFAALVQGLRLPCTQGLPEAIPECLPGTADSWVQLQVPAFGQGVGPGLLLLECRTAGSCNLLVGTAPLLLLDSPWMAIELGELQQEVQRAVRAGDVAALAALRSLVDDLGRWLEFVTLHARAAQGTQQRGVGLPAEPTPAPLPPPAAEHLSLMRDVALALLSTAMQRGWEHTAARLVAGLTQLGQPEPLSFSDPLVAARQPGLCIQQWQGSRSTVGPPASGLTHLGNVGVQLDIDQSLTSADTAVLRPCPGECPTSPTHIDQAARPWVQAAACNTLAAMAASAALSISPGVPVAVQCSAEAPPSPLSPATLLPGLRKRRHYKSYLALHGMVFGFQPLDEHRYVQSLGEASTPMARSWLLLAIGFVVALVLRIVEHRLWGNLIHAATWGLPVFVTAYIFFYRPSSFYKHREQLWLFCAAGRIIARMGIAAGLPVLHFLRHFCEGYGDTISEFVLPACAEWVRIRYTFWFQLLDALATAAQYLRLGMYDGRFAVCLIHAFLRGAVAITITASVEFCSRCAFLASIQRKRK